MGANQRRIEGRKIGTPLVVIPLEGSPGGVHDKCQEPERRSQRLQPPPVRPTGAPKRHAARCDRHSFSIARRGGSNFTHRVSSPLVITSSLSIYSYRLEISATIPEATSQRKHKPWLSLHIQHQPCALCSQARTASRGGNACTSSSTAAADRLRAACSSGVSSTSMIFTTPPAPKRTGTPT